jgi:hypothetical protein
MPGEVHGGVKTMEKVLWSNLTEEDQNQEFKVEVIFKNYTERYAP